MSLEKIDVKNLTWQQVCLCLGLMLAVMGAYKLFGELPAGVLLVLSSITNLLLGRTQTTVDTSAVASALAPAAPKEGAK